MRPTADLSTFDNSWYHPGKSGLTRLAWYFVNVLFFINPLNPFSGLKVRLLRMFGAHVGTGVVIKPAVNIKYPWMLTIGDHVWIGENVWIDNLTQVSLGDHTCISQGAMLLTGNHNYKRSSFDLMVGEIHLEAGAWIGAQCLVGPNVRVGSHAVLSAGSVTMKDLEPYQVYAGNPAAFVRERTIEPDSQTPAHLITTP
ncbi:WcaF family extracellular polysaccharide biosynthesis acetyltransferase [Pontibacter sp. G13]|uniref:WcaF family extracellular polysaccharide biosynthesis acetyltransferase n=1 Tax=Pontibacter sp. G13 TaxID=3074898 RepID=UPI00288B9623|nr:WcaF family extracellular polysaccharide biosynthesis acetyltransferase [Pontibacter sp. G13]WNJ19271.1 WcaF family extracellular polysaccharide biosynthesis acetyltransferase [Pontibacter sp. G13]